MLATFEGTAFQVSYVLASVAGIVIGAVMLQRYLQQSSRLCANSRRRNRIGPLRPKIGIYLSVISVPVLWVWYVLIARRLIRLGSGV